MKKIISLLIEEETLKAVDKCRLTGYGSISRSEMLRFIIEEFVKGHAGGLKK
jgi:metal-responsive CopG/Arc/MetJ family transcriptional regulator